MKENNILVTSKILVKNNRPTLFINNKMVETDSYLTYIDENQDYDAFNKIGFNLFSISIFNHSRTINENTQLKSFANGVLDSEDSIKLIDIKVKSIF